MHNPKLFRITTVPISVEKLLGNQLTFMNQFFDVTAISADEKELKRVGEELGVNTYSIEMTRKITPFQDLKSLWLMYHYFKKEKPNIVHTHTPKAGLIGMLAAKLAGVKVRMHTVAGLPLMETKGAKRVLLNCIEKLTYSCATKVYPNSYGLKDFIIKEKFCRENKLKVIANGSTNGIDVEYFHPDIFTLAQKEQLKDTLNIHENDFVFVFVGRLVKDKGINELISAFKKINSEFLTHVSSNLKLLLVGSMEIELDPLSEESQEEIESNSQIISVGFQRDVRPYLAISDALIFPSYREGFPNVVMQAGAMDLPSIVSNINGCNEIIKEGENGIIIPTKDQDAILQAMKIILEDKLHYNNLKNNSRKMIIERYEQTLIWKKLLEEYRSFI